MATKTNRRKYMILGKDIQRITGLKWTTIQWWIWRSSFKWDRGGTGKVKIGVRRKGRLIPIRGRRYSPMAVWDVNDFLNYHAQVFKKLASHNAWTRLHYDLNDFGDD
jgi:hypothetical protein